jgi:probable F420-dependent oxidoreductase
VRDFAQAVEGLGYNHLLALDHVLGIDPAIRPDWSGYYTHRSAFYEPFVLFGYLASVAPRLEFATDVLVLPQRQTPLVAKQAAVVDVLTGGRLRLGIGVGWNADEFAGLGANFHNRGRRCDEQIALLRALWTQPVVNFEGRYERVQMAGINPLPVQRPIPLWIGGGSDAALRRVARLGDGWFPPLRTPEHFRAQMEAIRGEAESAGRDPAAIGVEGRVWTRSADETAWARFLETWSGEAFSHLSFITMESGYTSTDQHIAAIRRFKEIAGEVLPGEALTP